MNPFKKFNTRNQGLPTTVSPFVFRDNRTLVPHELVSVESALKNPDVFSIVNRIASDIASSPIEIAPPYSDLVNKYPNHLMNPYSFWTSVLASMLLNGNAFVTMDKTKGVVQELELINANDVTVVLTDNARDILYNIHYQDERQDKVFKSADMLHFKLLSAGDSYNQFTGRSPLDSLADSINLQNYSNKLTLGTLKNGLAPTTTLTVPEGILGKEAKENIRQGFEEQNGGDNVGRVVVLDQGLQMDTISINADVAKFLNNINISKSVIAEAFGIPDSIINGTGDSQSSVQMQERQYAQSLNRYIKSLESELTFKLGMEAKLDITSGLDVDHQSLIANLNKLTANNQVISTQQAQQNLINHGVFIDSIDLPPENTGTNKGGETKQNGI